MNISIDAWLKEAKQSNNANKVGIWLSHNGTVRSSAKAEVREGIKSPEVKAMNISYNQTALSNLISIAQNMPGIYYLKVELANGKLNAGDDIMYVLIGADTRPHALDTFNYIMDKIKTEIIKETELF